MDIIDAHLHFSAIDKFADTAINLAGVEYFGRGLDREFRKNNVIGGIAMGLTESRSGAFPDKYSPNPMGIDLANCPENLFHCVGINPTELEFEYSKEIRAIELGLQRDSAVGIKLYPGYYPYSVTDPIYQGVYELAGKYDLPVVIHCGDTFCERGLLRYAHPIHVNQLAIKYPAIRFVIAHFGNPWVLDTGVILSNNTNVFADLSGLFLGNRVLLAKARKKRLIFNNLKTGIEYAEGYEQILFGSDWPLVEMEPYIDLVKQLIPLEWQRAVFHDNAQSVFTRLKI